ncbi:MAG TPA: PspC domain-containing protein, partial [Micromonosporaceae bacterium]|nr:PspC domain-containing protein [Micromonosporaceae bacterium]
MYPPTRRLHRRMEGRFLGGVASGIAEHLGISATAVRISFVVLLGLHGLGLLLYAVFWAVLPMAPVPTGLTADGQPVGRPKRRDPAQLLPFLAIGAGILIVQSLAGWGGANSVLGWLVAVVAFGAGLIYHQTAPERRRRSAAAERMPWLGAIVGASDRRTSVVLRILGGGVLVATGIISIVAVFSPLSATGSQAIVNGALLALVGLGGVALVAAPMLWRIFGALR